MLIYPIETPVGYEITHNTSSRAVCNYNTCKVYYCSSSNSVSENVIWLIFALECMLIWDLTVILSIHAWDSHTSRPTYLWLCKYLFWLAEGLFMLMLKTVVAVSMKSKNLEKWTSNEMNFIFYSSPGLLLILSWIHYKGMFYIFVIPSFQRYCGPVPLCFQPFFHFVTKDSQWLA